MGSLTLNTFFVYTFMNKEEYENIKKKTEGAMTQVFTLGSGIVSTFENNFQSILQSYRDNINYLLSLLEKEIKEKENPEK